MTNRHRVRRALAIKNRAHCGVDLKMENPSVPRSLRMYRDTSSGKILDYE